jgi:predicted transcriptional regulator
MALMAELKLVAQEDVAPLEERKLELEAELAELDEKIKSLKPADDSLAVYRAVYKAVKSGNTTLEDIAEAAGHGTATVDAMLKKHLTGKGGKQPIFTLKDDQYSLTPKAKRS